MPILQKPAEYERWLHGDIQEIIRFHFRPPPPLEDFEILETRGGLTRLLHSQI